MHSRNYCTCGFLSKHCLQFQSAPVLVASLLRSFSRPACSPQYMLLLHVQEPHLCLCTGHTHAHIDRCYHKHTALDGYAAVLCTKPHAHAHVFRHIHTHMLTQTHIARMSICTRVRSRSSFPFLHLRFSIPGLLLPRPVSLDYGVLYNVYYAIHNFSCQ